MTVQGFLHAKDKDESLVQVLVRQSGVQEALLKLSWRLSRKVPLRSMQPHKHLGIQSPLMSGAYHGRRWPGSLAGWIGRLSPAGRRLRSQQELTVKPFSQPRRPTRYLVPFSYTPFASMNDWLCPKQ